MELKLLRLFLKDTCTMGKLFIDGKFYCYTLEDKFREVEGEPVGKWKIPGETAIPRGRYQVIVDFSNRFQKDLPHILDVKGFDGVRLHGGNTDADTEGCPLLGASTTAPTGKTVYNCAGVVNKLTDIIKKETKEGRKVYITIV